MSEAPEDKTDSSSATLKAATITNAPVAHQASDSSPAAVASGRTLRDVQREIDARQVKFDEADEKYQQAVSFYTAAFFALKKEPNNETLSKELADATKFVEVTKGPVDISAQILADLRAERARLQSVANASSEQKNSPASQGLQNLLKLLQRPVEFQDDETKLLKVWHAPEGVELPFCGWPRRVVNLLFYRTSHSPLISLIFEQYREHCSNFELPRVPIVPEGAVAIDVSNFELPRVPIVPDGAVGIDVSGLDAPEPGDVEQKANIPPAIIPLADTSATVRGLPIKVVVKGPPGQGKSVFLNTILLEALPKGITVVCQTGAGPAFVFTPAGVREVPFPQIANIPELCTKHKDSYKTIYLYDPHQGTPASLLSNIDAFTLVASSPRDQNYLPIARVCHTFCVYPWTPSELKAVVPLITIDPSWWPRHEAFFANIGCSLRSLFMKPEEFDFHEKTLDAAIENITLEQLEAAIDAVKNSSEDTSKMSHRLVTYAPKNGNMDFKDFVLVPVSPKIRDKLGWSLNAKWKKAGRALLDFASTAQLAIFFAGYRGTQPST